MYHSKTAGPALFATLAVLLLAGCNQKPDPRITQYEARIAQDETRIVSLENNVNELQNRLQDDWMFTTNLSTEVEGIHQIVRMESDNSMWLTTNMASLLVFRALSTHDK